jgi:hypothetical protein
MDNDLEMVCEECGLCYQIIWGNDGQDRPIYFCPRCGSSTKANEVDDDSNP